MNRLIAATLLSLLCCSCSSPAEPETLVREGYDEDAMDAASQRARDEVDSFISELKSRKWDGYAVKVPVVDGDETEHFWLTAITYRNGVFSGLIGNAPGIVTNVEFGQKWEVPKEEISDWMYMRDEKIHGNYTIIPLLETMPEDQAAEMRSMLATP